VVLTLAATGNARYAFASHLAVLRSCPDVISKLLKSRGSVLLAAKVLVISRLLHTKLSQRPNPPPYLEILRNKIASLRRRLLYRIDRRFKDLDLAGDVVVEAMCAFALATSSSAKDVIRHFHHSRQEAMSESMMENSVRHESMLLALRLYVKTLRDTQAIIPSQLAHALEKLKSTSLFRSQDVYSLMELNLDVHERWIADDIKTFTPYIRHDDLSKAEAKESIKLWAGQAFSSFLGGLRSSLTDVQELHALMQLRGQVLELWLSNHQHLMGVDTAESLDGIREIFNLQAGSLIHRKASNLNRVGIIVYDALQAWQPDIHDSTLSLWDPSMMSIEMSHGGKDFREALTARSLGKNGPLNILSHEYMKFLSSIEAIEATIKTIQETKWQDRMEDVEDDDELLDNKQALLSVDDPRLMQEELNHALHEAYAELQSSLGKIQADLQEDDSSRCPKSCFLIRTWREIRQHLPKSYQNPSLGVTSIPELHRIIANRILEPPLQRCSRRLQKRTNPAGILPSRPLWEGDPELPVLPSPWTYRFLLDLMSSMTACGSDIWSPQATAALKKQVIVQLAALLKESLSHEATKVNGHVNEESDGLHDKTISADGDTREAQLEHASREATTDTPINGSTVDSETHPSEPTKPLSNDAKIQTFFDTAYLINATSIKDLAGEDNELVSLQSRLVLDLALEAESVDRIKTGAAEYWKRTSLLFGLLA
jgi:hypothetical protein